MLRITHSKDHDGLRIVSVPLNNVDKQVILDEEEFDLLMSLCLDPWWRLSANLVVRGTIPIARIILDAKKGEKVQYLDGNPLNLRRSNLIKTIGGGKSSTRDKLNKHNVLRKKIELDHIHILPSWEVQG